MKGKFIRGAYQLAENVTDLDAFMQEHGDAAKGLIDWADDNDIMMRCGTSDDNCFLCEYKIIRSTVAGCKGMRSELRHEIKARFPKAKEAWYGLGDQLF